MLTSLGQLTTWEAAMEHESVLVLKRLKKALSFEITYDLGDAPTSAASCIRNISATLGGTNRSD